MVQGNGGAFYLGRDVTNNIEFAMGTSVLGEAFAGALTNHKLALRTNNIRALTIDTSQRVGIGTDTPSEKLDVAGNANISGHLSAASKSFLIPHPVDSSKKLQYGSLESPYHGIRLTDKGKINSDFAQIDLPNYISKLVLQEGVNVQLTNINHDKTLFVKEVNIENNYFKVGMNRGWLDKNEYEFYWSFTAERKDIPKLIVEF